MLKCSELPSDKDGRCVYAASGLREVLGALCCEESWKMFGIRKSEKKFGEDKVSAPGLPQPAPAHIFSACVFG